MEVNWTIFRAVQGFEGYEISLHGLVRNRKTKKVLRPSYDRDGYMQVTLCRGGTSTKKRVNRLVAEAFIPNPQSLPITNHKDENKKNNYFGNLEWCTNQYNCTYGSLAKKMRPVLQYTLNGEYIAEYASVMDGSRATGANCGNIHNVCTGRAKTAGGFIFKFKEDEQNVDKIQPKPQFQSNRPPNGNMAGICR